MTAPSPIAGRRWIDADDRAFLHELVATVPGWLEDYAALRSMDLLALQERAPVTGSLLEIGVAWGRYFSLLLRSAVRTGERIVGVDTFAFVSADTVRELMAVIADPASIELVVSRSVDLCADDLRSMLGSEPRFISVDGSHEREDVHWDLELCEALVAPLGIVAVDDFLNPITLGVNEGVHRFFAAPRRLVPFAYTANKLFLSRPAAARRYASAFEACVVADGHEPRSEAFRKNLPDYRQNVEQHLWGSTLIVVP